jgi:hypothetical protein
VESLAILVTHQLPLADFFIFYFYFLILPDLLNNNTPVFFPEPYLGSLLVFI